MFNESDPSSPGHYDPKRTALLLLDFHTMFVEKAGGPQAADAVNVAVSLRKWAHSKGISVLHCVLDLNDTPFETCKGSAKLTSIIKAMREGGGGEEWSDLAQNIGEMDFTFTRKPGFVSALKSPGLESFLQRNGIKSLILTGLSTSGCVMRTAVGASDVEYVVTVISDGCADTDQEVHDMVVGKLINRGYVLTAKKFREGYENVRNL